MKIKLDNLSKSYQDADRKLPVISGVNFEFPGSGTIGIIGRSGVGKSTLLNLLGGLDLPTSGAVHYGETDLSLLSTDARAAFRANNIGFVFQFHHLLPEFSALENVAIPLVILGSSLPEACDKASVLLKRLGLEDRVSHRPSQLSGGEQQRVAIARALITKPKVVLADEPTGNLDADTAQEVQSLMLEMNRELGNVLVIVTHNRELAAGLDVVVEMVSGGNLVHAQK